MAKKKVKKRAVKAIEKAVRKAVHKGVAGETVELAVDNVIAELAKGKSVSPKKNKKKKGAVKSSKKNHGSQKRPTSRTVNED
jgi:hypothetical protein